MGSLIKNLKVKHKLAFMLVILIVFIIAIGSIGLNSMGSIYQNSEDITHVNLPTLDYLLQLDRDLHQALVAQRTMVFTDVDSDKFQGLVNDFEENVQQTKERWGKFKDVRPDGIKSDLLRDFEKKLDDWIKISNEITLLINSETVEGAFEAKEMLSSQSSKTFSEAREIINYLTEVNEKMVEEAEMSSEASYNNAYKILLIGLVLITILSVISGSYISHSISKPIANASLMMHELKMGHLSARVDIDSKDEIGVLGQAMNSLADTLQEITNTMYKIADGDLSAEAESLDKDDEISPALNKIIHTLRNLQKETEYLIESALNGELKKRGSEDKFNGVYRNIIRGINNTLDAVLEPLNESAEILSQLENRDFTKKVIGNYKGDHQLMKNSINTVIESLNSTLNDVSEAVKATASASVMISSSSEEMAAGAEEQSMQSSEVAAAVEQMTQTILETSQNISVAAEKSKDAGEIAKNGGLVVEDTILGMNRIAEVVNHSAGIVKELGNSSNQIGEIIQVINDIADQTNLLALNAAIEAARAGEQGRGFAVVADEVKKLAERTASATKEIAEMISKIQKDTIGAVKSIEQGTSEVDNGISLAQKAGKSLTSIIESTDEVFNLVSQVAVASEEQSAASEQISKNVESISRVAQDSASGVEQIARASEDLNQLTDNLQNVVDQFRIHQNIKNYNAQKSDKLVEV